MSPTPFDPWVLREAVASVALSHDPHCKCTTCRAADGDVDAWNEIVLALATEDE